MKKFIHHAPLTKVANPVEQQYARKEENHPYSL
jgi:hypothetical protein